MGPVRGGRRRIHLQHRGPSDRSRCFVLLPTGAGDLSGQEADPEEIPPDAGRASGRLLAERASL